MRKFFGSSSRVVMPVLVLAFLGGAQLACDKSKDKSADEGKSSKSDKKEKKHSADDDDDDDDDEPKGVEVPGTKGFLVPPGGTYKHNSFDVGDQTLVMESYEYPIKKFPRAELRKSLGAFAKQAGWKLKQDVKDAPSVDAVKKGQMVTVLIGEAKPETTILNVTPPIPAPDGDDGSGEGSGESFAGDYNSNFGAATITQQGTKVTIKYALGTATCTAAGKKLTCHWIETTSSGDAVMTKQADGKLVGTWGSGSSSTNGGGWTFTPKKK